MEDLIIGTVRKILWGLVDAALGFIDGLYNIVISISKLDLFDIQSSSGTFIIDDLWKVASIFLLVAIVIRIVWMLFEGLIDVKKVVEEDLLKKVIIILLTFGLISFIPYLMKGIGSAMVYVTDHISYFFSGESDNLLSTIILTASDDNEIVYWSTNQDGVAVAEHENRVINLSDIEDINEKHGGVYVHFNKMSTFFIALICSIFCFIQLLAVAMDTAKRWYDILVCIIFSFIPISSIIDDGDGFRDWIKYFFFQYLSNYIELFSMMMTMALALSLKDQGYVVQMIMLLGGFLFAQSGSSFLSKFMGIDSGTSSLQQLANTAQIATPALQLPGRVLDTAKHVAGRAITGVGAVAGKLAGGVGINNYGKMQTSVSAMDTYGSENSSPYAQAISEAAGNQSFSEGISQAFSQSQGSSYGSQQTYETGDFSGSPLPGQGNNNDFANAIGESVAASTGSRASGMAAAAAIGDPSYGSRQQMPGQSNSQTGVQARNMARRPAATRIDTYSYNPVWKDKSLVSKMVNYGNSHNDTWQGKAVRGIGLHMTRSYENNLRKRQQRRGF